MDFILLHWHCILPIVIVGLLMIPKKSDRKNNSKDEIDSIKR